MASTFTQLDYHLIFSTKHRRRWISPSIEARVWEYLAGIALRNGMRTHRIGGIDDHIHMALGIPPTIAVSQAMRLLKGNSSKWIGETFPRLRGFGWQDGNAAFTVRRSVLPAVVEYILNQRDHHQRRSFLEEFRALLERHGIPYEERFLWS